MLIYVTYGFSNKQLMKTPFMQIITKNKSGLSDSQELQPDVALIMNKQSIFKKLTSAKSGHQLWFT